MRYGFLGPSLEQGCKVKLIMFSYRVRASVSQWYTPTQRFTEYPPRIHGSWDKEKEGEDVVLQLMHVKYFVFLSIRWMNWIVKISTLNSSTNST